MRRGSPGQAPAHHEQLSVGRNSLQEQRSAMVRARGQPQAIRPRRGGGARAGPVASSSAPR